MRNHPDLPADAPQWVRDADIERPVWRDGVWYGGVWCSGEWRGGEWHDGVWCGGVWHDGDWYGGVWYGGVWHDGVWYGGVWCGGEWRGGEWRCGVWRGGEWRGKENRLLYMASLLGIVFNESGHARAYRTTHASGRGRWMGGFVQPEGEYYEDDAMPAGNGTCCKGIHVTSAARAHTYFGVLHDAQMWAVDFKREELLDCDGEKARIRGGVFTKIARPF